MSVLITKVPPQISNRRLGYDRQVREIAPLIAEMQAVKIVAPADIANALNADGVTGPGGRAWRAVTIWRLIRRAVELGIELKRRSRAEAAIGRPVSHRARAPRRS